MATKAQPQRVSLGQSATVPGHTLPSSAGSAALAGQATASQQQQQQQQQQHQQASSSSSSAASSSSILNSTSLALALPHSQQCSPVTHVDSNALQYLAMEMAPVLRKSARVALRRRQSGLAQLVEAGLVPSTSSSSSSKTLPASELEDETVARLEAIGAHVGSAFAERLSRDRPPFGATLDVVKFVCKDVWTACFDKQVDNLRTNHRGVYVLQDNHFRPLLRLSTTMAAGPGALAPATRLVSAAPFP